MSKQDFQFDKLYKELVGSVSKPNTKRLFNERPRESVELFLSGQNKEIPSNRLYSMGMYCLMEAVVLCPNDEEAANNKFLDAVLWRVCALRNGWYTLLNAKRQGATGGMIDTLNEVSMLLALAIVAELPDFAAEVVEVLIRGLELKLFGRADSLPVAEFIIRVYARWRGLSIQTESAVLLDGHEYGLLLNHLENRKIEGAGDSLIKACDYHVSRSKSSTSRVTYEFDDYCYRIYPAEIFAFIKVCEHLNLDFERPNHPIINTPLARLGQPEKRKPDVLLEKVLNVLAVIK